MNSNKPLFAAGFLLGLSGFVVIGMTLGQHSIERKIKAGLDQQISKHSEDAIVTYRNVKASFITRKISVNGIQYTSLKNNPKELTVKIDHVEISDLDMDTIIHMATNSKAPILPKSMRVGVSGVHLTAELLGEKAAQQLAEFQYTELNLSVAMGVKIDRAAKTVRLDEMGLEIADLGKLSTTWDFNSVELPSDEQLAHPDQFKEAFANKWKSAALHYADFKYVDLGFLKRFDRANQAKGKPSLAQSAEQLAQMMGRSPAKLSFVNDAIPKIKDFLTNGGTIALRSKPAKDQPLVELANPMAFLDPNGFATQIGLSVEVTH
jgi:hypothetical protein